MDRREKIEAAVTLGEALPIHDTPTTVPSVRWHWEWCCYALHGARSSPRHDDYPVIVDGRRVMDYVTGEEICKILEGER